MDPITAEIFTNLKTEIFNEVQKEKTARFKRIVKNEASAKNYAKAMFDAANELKKIDIIKKDFDVIYSSLFEDKDTFSFFTSNFIDGNVRVDVIRRAYENKISHEALNLLSILVEKDLFNILPAIIVEYENLCNEFYDIVSVRITIAKELEGIEELKRKIIKMVNKNVHFYIDINESIIGGIIVEIEDIIYDYSMKRLLNSVKDSLLAE